MSFENCGQQIKNLAKALRWVLFIIGAGALIMGLLVFCDDGHEMGLVLMFAGLLSALAGWIGSLFLFGFGIIVAEFEDKAKSEQVKTSSATPPHPVQPLFASEDAKELITNIDLAGTVDAVKTTLAPVAKKAVGLKDKFRKTPKSTLKITAQGWVCPDCNAINPHHVGTCQSCSTTKPR